MKRFLLAAAIFLTPDVYAQTAQLSDPFPRRITVAGSAESSVTPDEIYLNVTLKEYVRKGAPKKELDALIASFMSACKSAGIADSAITVSGIGGGSDERYYWTKSRRPEELLGEISYEVKVNSFDKISVLADNLEDGASFNVSRISSSQASTIRKQLKINAVKAAREKARYLAEAAGESIGQAISIEEPDETPDAYLNESLMNSRITANTISAEADVASGNSPASRKIRYRFEVKVVFALK